MKNRKSFLNLFLLGCFVLVFMSSCNRGYGCPYDFSTVSPIEQLFNIAFKLVSSLF